MKELKVVVSEGLKWSWFVESILGAGNESRRRKVRRHMKSERSLNVKVFRVRDWRAVGIVFCGQNVTFWSIQFWRWSSTRWRKDYGGRKGYSSKVWLKLTEGKKKGAEVHFYHNLPWQIKQGEISVRSDQSGLELQRTDLMMINYERFFSPLGKGICLLIYFCACLFK